MLVELGWRTEVVETAITVGSAIKGIVDFGLRRAREVVSILPKAVVESLFGIGYLPPSATPGTKLLFFPSDESQPYLTFEGRMSPSGGRMVFEFVVEHGRIPTDAEVAECLNSVSSGQAA